MLACGIVLALSCAKVPADAPASPAPAAVGAPSATLTDPCGGAQELLKKYLSASPCTFVRGQAGIQMTYSGTNVSEPAANHAIGYPGTMLNIGVTPSSQITLVLPSFSRIANVGGVVAGASDVQFRYKQLAYVDRVRGILAGVLLTYQAPTGSPGIAGTGPSYEFNPLLNVALNRARSIGENVSFPLTNTPSQNGSGRTWTFSPQAVTFWRSPAGTLFALVLQHACSTGTTYLTINAAQLVTRNFQLQGTFGGNSLALDYANPIEDAGHAGGIAYSRSFTIGASYMIVRSELPPP